MTPTENLQLLDGLSGPAGKAAAAMLRAEQAAVSLQSAMNRETDLANRMERAAQKVDLLTGTLGYQKNIVASLEQQFAKAKSLNQIGLGSEASLKKLETALDKARQKEEALALDAATAGDNLLKQQRDAELAAQKTELLSKELDQAKRASDGASEGVEKTGKAAEKSGNKASGAVQSFMKLASSLVSMKNIKAGVTFLFEGAANRQQQQARMEALLGRTGGKLFEQYEMRAQVTAFETKDYVAAINTISQVTEKESELTRIMSQAERAAAKRGGGLDTYAEALRAVYSGDVSGAQKALGLTNAEAEALKAAKGVEELDAAIEAALTRMGATDELVEKMGMTAASRWQNLKEKVGAGFAEAGQKVLTALEPVLQRVSDWLDSPMAQAFFDMLSNGLAALVQGVAWVVDKFVQGAQWVYDNWEQVKTVLFIIGSVALTLMIAKLWATVPPVLAQAAAWMIAYWPIMLVVAAIVLVIAAARAMGATFEDILGFIGGLFGGIIGVVYNVAAAIYNIMASAMEALANFFNDPIGSIVRLFYDLADVVLSIIQTLAGAIDAVFGSNLADAVQGWRNSLSGWVTDIWGEPAIRFDRMEVWSIPEAVGVGARNFGKVGKWLDDFDVSTKFDGLLDNTGDAASEIKDMGSIFSGAGGGSGGKVHMDEPIEISSEDLKVMRDLAEREAIQYFVTLHPSVTVSGNEFSTKSEWSIDEFADALGERVREETEAAASGVFLLQPVG